MTFSIIAYDPETGDLGVGVASKFLAVGSIVPHARAKVGAIATQSYACEYFGPVGLTLLEKGLSPEEVLNKLLFNDQHREKRQVAIINAKGQVAAFTGRECIEWAGHIIGDHFSVQGNILTGPEVLKAMASAFRETNGELVDKLIASLEAGEIAGGDKRGKQSAALLVVREKGGFLGESDKYVDLRVDDHPDPIRELKRLFNLYDSSRLYRLGSRELLLTPQRDVKEIQRVLAKLGFYRGEIDGFPNKELEQAIREYRKSKGLMDIAYVDIVLIKMLKSELKHI